MDIVTSPSDVGLFQRQPFVWLAKRHTGHRTISGPSAWLGNAAEVALHQRLLGENGWLQFGLDQFEQSIPQNFDRPSLKVYTDQLEPMVNNAFDLWPKDVKIDSYQQKVEQEITVNNVKVHIRGFIDFRSKCGRIIDLKTTQRMPTEPRPNHVEQVSWYCDVTGSRGWLLYSTKAKGKMVNISEKEQVEALRRFRSSIYSMTKIAQLEETMHWTEVARLFPVDLTNFDYDADLRALARTIHDF